MENFILEYQMPDSDLHICDDLMKYHRDNEDMKSHGTVTKGIDKDVKDSLDVYIHPANKNLNSYMIHLHKAFDLYKSKYPSYPGLSAVSHMVNIQYYRPGGGFKTWHHERDCGRFANVGRNLVFMTYLNDVKNGGTEWMYQNYKSEAKKGLTVLWPSDFTHTHRGIISNTEEKFIITGWFVFKENLM